MAKFHVAVFCSNAAYPETRAFYTAIFGATSYEGPINEGSDTHVYDGSVWDQECLCFGLLNEPNLIGVVEQLAHVGLIFNASAEFDVEIQRRNIDLQQIKVLPAGQRQVFVQDESGVEWELSCSEIATS